MSLPTVEEELVALAELDRQQEAERRKARREAQARLAEAEARQAAAEQAGEVSEARARLSQRFRELAQGKPWYSGNEEVDPILPYQWDGVQFGAAAKRYILADGMGLGKTRQSIAWLDLVEAKKVLIVCLPDICDQFAGEVMELAPHRTVVNLYKKSKQTRHELMDSLATLDEAVVVVNFEIWRQDKDFLAKLIAWHVDSLIVDEAHNLKSTSSGNFKNIEMLVKVDNVCGNCRGHIYGTVDTATRKLKPCPTCGWKSGDPTAVRPRWELDKWLLTKSIKNVCFTTGTPLLNSPMDLFSLLTLLDPVMFNSQKMFKKAFLITNHHSGKIEFRTGQLANLKPLIAGRFIQRDYTEAGIVLPKQRQHLIRVDLDPVDYAGQHKIIRQLTEAAAIMLESGEKLTIMHLIALITRKRQANVWPAGIELRDEEGNVVFSVGNEVQESVKLDAAMEQILKLHAEGRRQVVFSQFSTGINAFADQLKQAGLRVAVITGATPKAEREIIKANFDRRKLGTDGEVLFDIVLCNYKTGGTGLNLTAATAIHITDEEWNAGKRNQAYARTDRIGQTEENDVFVYRIPASIDTWMSNIINRKEKMVSQFNETMTGDTTKELVMDLQKAMRDGEVM